MKYLSNLKKKNSWNTVSNMCVCVLDKFPNILCIYHSAVLVFKQLVQCCLLFIRPTGRTVFSTFRKSLCCLALRSYFLSFYCLQKLLGKISVKTCKTQLNPQVFFTFFVSLHFNYFTQFITFKTFVLLLFFSEHVSDTYIVFPYLQTSCS